MYSESKFCIYFYGLVSGFAKTLENHDFVDPLECEDWKELSAAFSVVLGTVKNTGLAFGVC